MAVILLEDEHSVVTHLALKASDWRTACDIAYRIVERYDSCIELMTPTDGPPTCLWCARARMAT